MFNLIDLDPDMYLDNISKFRDLSLAELEMNLIEYSDIYNRDIGPYVELLNCYRLREWSELDNTLIVNLIRFIKTLAVQNIDLYVAKFKALVYSSNLKICVWDNIKFVTNNGHGVFLEMIDIPPIFDSIEFGESNSIDLDDDGSIIRVVLSIFLPPGDSPVLRLHASDISELRVRKYESVHVLMKIFTSITKVTLIQTNAKLTSPSVTDLVIDNCPLNIHNLKSCQRVVIINSLIDKIDSHFRFMPNLERLVIKNCIVYEFIKLGAYPVSFILINTYPIIVSSNCFKLPITF